MAVQRKEYKLLMEGKSSKMTQEKIQRLESVGFGKDCYNINVPPISVVAEVIPNLSISSPIIHFISKNG